MPVRERALLGNYAPYANVEESATINVYGQSATEALEALDDLNAALEQAEAWAMGEAVQPVLIRVQILGSELADPLEAVILGRSDQLSYMVRLQPTFNQDLALYEIANVEIRFMRSGLWLGEATTKALANTVTNPALMTVDMGERLRLLSPTTVKVTGFDSGTPMLGSGFLILTGASPLSNYGRNIAIYAAAAMTSTEFTSQDDSENLAHNDDVMRIDAATNQDGTLTISQVYAEVTRLSIFAAVRNNSATTTWQVRAKSTGYVTTTDRWRTIDATSQDPRIVYVGTLGNQSGTHINIALEFEASANSGTLDVNYILIVGHDQSTYYVAIDGASYSAEAFTRALVVADRSTSHKTPMIYIETNLE